MIPVGIAIRSYASLILLAFGEAGVAGANPPLLAAAAPARTSASAGSARASGAPCWMRGVVAARATRCAADDRGAVHASSVPSDARCARYDGRRRGLRGAADPANGRRDRRARGSDLRAPPRRDREATVRRG